MSTAYLQPPWRSCKMSLQVGGGWQAVWHAPPANVLLEKSMRIREILKVPVRKLMLAGQTLQRMVPKDGAFSSPVIKDFKPSKQQGETAHWEEKSLWIEKQCKIIPQLSMVVHTGLDGPEAPFSTSPSRTLSLAWMGSCGPSPLTCLSAHFLLTAPRVWSQQ